MRRLLRYPVASILGVTSLSAVAIMLLAAAPSTPAGDDRPPRVAQAVGDDRDAADRAIVSLRADGPEGLAEFQAAHAASIEGLKEKPACLWSADSAERRVADALDQIAGQRDAASSGLYWYTDLDAAKAAARREQKPILSLWMMGKLTDELSCANSRYFRTTLYADERVAEYLRGRCILHWRSVRPVPKITVDYGDGRRLERTITGNSAHYVLDSSGRVVDVLPGLYAPQSFLALLHEALSVAERVRRSDLPARNAALAAWHGKRYERLKDLLADREMPTDDLGWIEEVFFPFLNPPAQESPISQSAPPPPAPSAKTAAPPAGEPLRMVLGSSHILAWRSRIVQAQTNSPAIAELESVSPTEFRITAKSPGVTQLYVVPEKGDYQIVDVTVYVNGNSLARLLEAKFAETPIQLTQSGNGIVVRAFEDEAFEKESPTFKDQFGWLAHDVKTYPAATETFPIAVPKGFGELAIIEDVTGWSMPSRPWVGAQAARKKPSDLVPPAPEKLAITAEGIIRGWVAQCAAATDPWVRFSPSSERLIRAKMAAMPAEFLPGPRAAVEAKALLNFRRAVAADTIRNEFDLHRQIHAWLTDDAAVDLEKLNDRIYAELFLTPREDPWLGLLNIEAYTAIDAHGVVIERRRVVSSER
jgi:hypothetical protein